MSSQRNSPKKWTRFLVNGAALSLLSATVAGCVLEPLPPPGPPMAAVPELGYAPPAYVAPGYYAYPEYPPYYYGAYGPSVGLYYGGGGGGYRHWR